MSQQSFADLGVSSAVVDALSRAGITSPFAVQRLVIEDVLAGRDVLAKSPTGSGKTLAFGIPIADRIQADGPRPAALVLAPTRELATQIVQDIRPIAHARALRVTAVYGGVGLTKQAQAASRSHIVVATPGRLEDLLERRSLTLSAIQVLVLDEADRMLDMGFRPAVDRIIAGCPKARQTLFFSATLDGDAGRLATRYTRDAQVHEHGPRARRAAADVEHRFIPVPARDASRRWSRSSIASASWRWSLCGPSAARTGSSNASAPTACTPWRCTATGPSASASRRCRASRPGPSTRWWRPTSRLVGSTSAGYRT